MKCFICKDDFPENKIQESHDVPCYLFEGNRKGRKNQADKYGRHWLCERCHKIYESILHEKLVGKAVEFSKNYFETLRE